ncbi:MAG TPA: hypothetical protein VF085_03165 [Solirubrobacterales bacterium]
MSAGGSLTADGLATESRLSRALRALRLERRLSVGELCIALIGLGAIGLLALGPRIQHGGFSMDDWSNAVLALNPSGSRDFGHALSDFASFTIYRPVLVVYVPLTYFVFGMHMHYHLAFAAVLAVLVATMFYGVLRTLGVPWVHAATISALTIVFPWSDSTRLWVTADQLTLSLFFMFAGLLIALQGLRRPGWKWHGCAVLLYLLSILTYEITLPLIACLGVLYWVLVGWQAAKWRWLADLTVAVAGGIWVWTNTVKTKSGISDDLAHSGEIIKKGGEIFGRAAFPFGSPETGLVLAVVAVLLCLGVWARFAFPQRFASQGSWGLQQWLALTAGGVVLASLGWVIFIPAEPYYTPTIFGEVNRVNGLAAFGLILAVYGSFGTLAVLVCQAGARGRLPAAVLTALLGVVLLASYTHVLRRHIQLWNTAYDASAFAIQETKRQLPRLPSGTTVIASGYPAYQAPGVPILATDWDYDGMVRMEYADSSLSAYPLLEYLHVRLVCRAEDMAVQIEGRPERTVAYGTVRLLDLATGVHANPKSPDECRREVDEYVPGPTFLSETY